MWPDLGGGTGRVRQGAEKGVRKGGRKERRKGRSEGEREKRDEGRGISGKIVREGGR